MSTISESPIPREPHQSGVLPLWCRGCGTDRHLHIDSIQAGTPRSCQRLDVFYTCMACGISYSHPATVQHAGAILNRRGIQDGLLELGNHYFHCGEPLREIKTALRRFETPQSGRLRSRRSPPETLLHTKILRCRCGFELEIPA